MRSTLAQKRATTRAVRVVRRGKPEASKAKPLSALAHLVGVSTAQVTTVVRRGDLDAALLYVKGNGRPMAKIVDMDLAVELWRSRPSLLDHGNNPGRKRQLEKEAAEAAKLEDESGEVRGSIGRVPAALSDIAEARLEFETYKAKGEKLKYEEAIGAVINAEKAKAAFGKMISEAKNAIMQIGTHARSRIPHLSHDDVATIEDLCREALEGLTVEARE